MTAAIVLQLILNGLAMGTIYVLLALGISLIWSASSLFNFAQADLLTLGGYVMLTLFSGVTIPKMPFIPAFAITVAVMATLGYSLSRIYFYPMFANRVNSLIILIGTVAFSVFVRNAILVVWGTTPQTYANPFGSQVLQFGDLYLMPHVIWIVAIVTVLLILLQYFLRGTMVGIAMRAVAQRPTAAWLMGIRNDRMIALTFLLSTGMAAVAGVLISPIMPLTPSMGGMIAVKAMAAVLIGGLGSFTGALIGGVAVGISEAMFATLVTPAYRDVFIFLVLVLFMLFKPGGLFRAQVSEKI